MKAHLLFSSLFMAALALSPLVAQSKTSHHKHKQINTDEKSFPTGTFYQEPTMGGYYNQKNDDYENYPINTADDRVVIKKMDSFSADTEDTYLVYFVGTQFATHQYSCRFAGIFEQKTKKKELTLVDSYKKLNCPIKIIGDTTRVRAYNSSDEYPSCNEFCDSQMGGGLGFGYLYPYKNPNKHNR